MALPMTYNIRNLLTRKLTPILTVAGMSLVVFVFATIMMLAEGLQKALVETGSYDNVVVIRKGSNAEVMSGIEREKVAVMETFPEIAAAVNGDKLAAREMVVLITLNKRSNGKPSNVTIRGIDRHSLELRPQVRLVAGRLPRVGALEVMVGRSIQRQFVGMDLNRSFYSARRNWRIVGIFDAGSTGYSSEIWGDATQFMQAFRRPVYSSLTFKLRDPSTFQQVRQRIATDPRLNLDAKRETTYYTDQSEMMAKFLRIIGFTLTLIFSIGAIIGAMITMYASVAHRTTEIGTLRALGFQRRNILAAFLIESLLLGFCGGLFGLGFASLMQLVTVSTLNFQTFSELAFRFTLSSKIAIQAISFSLIMGFVGGFLPALRASRMKIVDALRAA